MAQSILQNIADEILARLLLITVTNGYEFNVSSVEFASRDSNTWTPAPRKVYIEQQEQTENESLSCPGNPPKKANDVEFHIWGFSHQLDVDTTEPGVTETGTTDNQVMAAMEKAIAANDIHWHQFDGNAINASIQSGVRFDGVGHNGAMVNLTVTYRVSELDPYTVSA